MAYVLLNKKTHKYFARENKYLFVQMASEKYTL